MRTGIALNDVGVPAAPSSMSIAVPDCEYAVPATRMTSAIAAVALALCGDVACAVEEPVPSRHTDLQVTYEHSSGRYGDPGRTRIDNLTVVGRHRWSGWLMETQVPFLEIRTDSGRSGLPDSVGSGSGTEKGLGDINFLISRELLPFTDDGLGIDATVKVKTKSGDVDRGLGSGGTDFALQVDGIQRLGDWIAFGHAGYRRTGDVPGFPRYRNPWYAEGGGYRSFGTHWEAGGYYDFRQAIGRLGPLREATAYLGIRIDAYKLQAYVTKGFATASPDWAVGVALRRRF